MASHSKLFIGLFKRCLHSALVGRLNTAQHSTACDHCTVTTQHADDILIPVRTASVDFLNSTTTQVETAKLATCYCIGSMFGICCVWFIAQLSLYCVFCWHYSHMINIVDTRMTWVIESHSSTAKPDHLNINMLIIAIQQSKSMGGAYQCSTRAVGEKPWYRHA